MSINNAGHVLVDVFEGQLKEREGSFKNDAGESIAYHTRAQDGRLEAGGFAYPIDVRLAEGQKPFSPGRYVLRLDKMLKVNNGKLSLDKFHVLEPVAK